MWRTLGGGLLESVRPLGPVQSHPALQEAADWSPEMFRASLLRMAEGLPVHPEGTECHPCDFCTMDISAAIAKGKEPLREQYLRDAVK